MPAPSRIAAALEYFARLKAQADQLGAQTQMQTANVAQNFFGGVRQNLANRARDLGQIGYEAFTSDPVAAKTTAEVSEAAAQRQPTPMLDATWQGLGQFGKALVTDPVGTGRAMVSGELERARTASTSPAAAGEYAASFIDPMRIAKALRAAPSMRELIVHHGTPHTFEPTEANPLGEFDASKIGTGEGAQAYGHGVYLAESPDVAKGYAETLANRVPTNQNRLNAHANAQRLANLAGDPKFAADDIRFALSNEPNHPQKDLLQETLSFLETGDYSKPLKNSGSLYKADLPDEMIDRMIDYDVTFNQQPEGVKTALLTMFPSRIQKTIDYYGTDALPMSQLFHHLGNDAVLAENLRKNGIPGIKYYDQGSRQGEKQTRNFVVFPGEEKKVRILERNGQPAPERIAQALEAAPTTARRPTALPTIKPGDVVDGYKVRPDIPNQSSIAASLDNYEVLPGIRSINMTEFDPQYVRSISPDKLDSRTRKLMDEISQSKELNPLIVAYDSKGPYIIEGGHRFDALAASKAKSVPAMVVIDMDDPPR